MVTNTSPYKKTSGFTLVELLVVVAIVATLAVVSTLATKNVLSNAKIAACASNLRQIGLAMQMYADDNQGTYPDSSHTASQGKAWIYQLKDYLGKFDEIRICPADPKAALRRRNESSSYILNSSVFLPPVDVFGDPIGKAYNKPAWLPEPSKTILVFIASDRAGLYPGDDHTHSDQWSSWTRVTADISPDRHKKQSSNYLYADGTVKTINANEIKSEIEKGNNIATIPGITP